MPARKQSEFRTIVDCDKIHEKKASELKERDQEMKSKSKVRLTVTISLIIAILGIGTKLMMAHTTNEVAQDVNIGKTQVEVIYIKEEIKGTREEVKEIQKDVDRLEDMDKKLDTILLMQEFRP
jgi:hypothetical protein